MKKRDIKELALQSACGVLEDGADSWDPPPEIEALPRAEADEADELWREEIHRLAHRMNVAGVR